MSILVQPIIRRHLEAVKKGIAVQMAAMGRNASGRSVASLTVYTDDKGGYLEGLSSFLAMERGRKGGKVPYNFTEIIAEWIKDKGLPYESLGSTPERGLRKLAGAIAFSIMKHGTRLHRDNGYNDIYTSVLEKEMTALASEISSVFELEIDTINGMDFSGNNTR